MIKRDHFAPRMTVCVLTLLLTFVPAKGHAAPVLYAVWTETGYLKESELLNLRKVDSILEGHPVPVGLHSDLRNSVSKVIYSKIPSRTH